MTLTDPDTGNPIPDDWPELMLTVTCRNPDCPEYDVPNVMHRYQQWGEDVYEFGSNGVACGVCSHPCDIADGDTTTSTTSTDTTTGDTTS